MAEPTQHLAPGTKCPYCDERVPSYASEGWWRHLFDVHPEHITERPSTLRNTNADDNASDRPDDLQSARPKASPTTYSAPRYEVVTLRHAKENGWPPPSMVSWEHESMFDEWDYADAIYLVVDGVGVECIGTDGGEPEDQTLRRDWRWVAPALQAAYDRGRADRG